jgi:hypothetical protein
MPLSAATPAPSRGGVCTHRACMFGGLCPAAGTGLYPAGRAGTANSATRPAPRCTVVRAHVAPPSSYTKAWTVRVGHRADTRRGTGGM